MAIRPKHLHVDATGLCYLVYLSNWRADVSTLSGAIYDMIHVFSKDPPVYAVESPPTSPTSLQIRPQQPNIPKDDKGGITEKTIAALTDISKQTATKLTNDMEVQAKLESSAKYLESTIGMYKQEEVEF
jgi:hypothetical protein